MVLSTKKSVHHFLNRTAVKKRGGERFGPREVNIKTKKGERQKVERELRKHTFHRHTDAAASPNISESGGPRVGKLVQKVARKTSIRVRATERNIRTFGDGKTNRG